jgi:hypothetical protein
MKNYKLLNNVFGWLAFAIAAVTYLLTMEPTASFWDCGEFISSAFKLDVGHPPGAPFFMLMGHFFSLFAKDTTQVAYMVNSLSALASAATILFLFWTITNIARSIVIKSEEDYTTSNIIAILGTGLVGALAYTFSDTFWFSAVEGEVYASSSLFTAIVFWAILKWESVAEDRGSDRWLILIAYLMGLSIGVHLLNLLAIPAIVLVYYFKNYNTSTRGVVLAMLASFVILAFVLYGLIPGSVEVASWFELLFVNKLGFSFNTGLYVYLFLAVGLLSWAIYESYVDKSYLRMTIAFVLAFTIVGMPFLGNKVWLGLIIIAALSAFFYFKRETVTSRWLNTLLVMMTVLMIGYSTYAVIVIRSSAKPTMDQNAPDNVFSLKYYLNREQYGDRPLLYGPVYSAPVKLKIEGETCIPVTKKGDAIYAKKPKTSPTDKDEYLLTGYKTEYVMNEQFDMVFPRLYSTSSSHIEAYKNWANIKGTPITFDYCGQQRTEIKPTFGENIKFFVEYQVMYMYMRYFMWNFSGRQNDLQGSGEVDKGNCITGFGFIDNALLGDQTNMPAEFSKNKGHNVYYLLPLLLGVIGMIYMFKSGKKGKEGFWITALLFFLTGLAIVIYLNQTPYQPRERDYAYAGSFYAFCIWIGFGVLGLYKLIEKYVPKTVAATLVSVLCLGVPALMAQQNWDDHDRSNRYTCRDFGANYLHSCEENAIIFTNGDNDTFPLWYNQEVEGTRTDVRVCNLSYLQTDWYINQMKRGAYKSSPLPISWAEKDYVAGKNEVVSVDSMMPGELELKTAYDFVLSTDPQTKMQGDAFIPSKKVYINVDAAQVLKTKTVPAERASEILPRLDINLSRRMTKSDLMILEMLKENNWKRPVYFAVTVGNDSYLGLEDHFEMTGMAYRILPVGAVKGMGSQVNTDKMYDNMMNKFRYGGIDNPKVYIDETVMRMCHTHRMMFSELIEALVNKGDTVRALKALDYCNKVIPDKTVSHTYRSGSVTLANCYYRLGHYKEGNQIMEPLAQDCVDYLTWSLKLPTSKRVSVGYSINMNLIVLQQVLRVCDQNKQKAMLDKFLPPFMEFSQKVQM